MPAEWADVKPRFCPTPTCELSVKRSKGRKSFRNNPEMLETTFHETHHERKQVTVTSIEYEAPAAPKHEGHSGQRRSKSKATED